MNPKAVQSNPRAGWRLRGNSSNPFFRRNAFTLIELLVVIAIISLLVSILVPSLTKAKELARQTQCQASLHAVGIGWHTYAVEYDDCLPLVHYDSGGWSEQRAFCEWDVENGYTGVGLGMPVKAGLLTEVPMMLTGNREDWTYSQRGVCACPSYPLSSLEHPNFTSYLMDRRNGRYIHDTRTYEYFFKFSELPNPAERSQTACITRVHAENERGNAMYLDGHAELVDEERCWWFYNQEIPARYWDFMCFDLNMSMDAITHW
ncbi:MAG: prepilin-type N-terminal cleavage/methylation domain-containing protein [Phycisphaerae bacterium]|nr:prepilin-type N-terminal cleavage/methylation domain-containing protein [Phycisphaerae bacterium]